MNIINYTDPTNPQVTSRLYYSNANVNAIEQDNGYIYIVSGEDVERSARATSYPFVAKIKAEGGRLNLDAGITYGFKEGYNATDLEVTTTEVIVTSGQDGFVTIYNKSDLTASNEASYSDLRSLAVKDNTIAVLNASQGIID